MRAEVRDGVKEFLETFFKVYPTATKEELRYYFKETDPRAVGRSLSLEKVSDIAIEETEDGKSLKASCIVSYANEETGLKEAGSYMLIRCSPKRDGTGTRPPRARCPREPQSVEGSGLPLSIPPPPSPTHADSGKG